MRKLDNALLKKMAKKYWVSRWIIKSAWMILWEMQNHAYIGRTSRQSTLFRLVLFL